MSRKRKIWLDRDGITYGKELLFIILPGGRVTYRSLKEILP
jgi:hypothetical protein